MRTCGTCSLCCKVGHIKELNKPAGVWCPNARPGKGCIIYGNHPSECQTFKCAWLNDENMGDEWKPTFSKLVVRVDGTGIFVHCDPGARGAWKKEPYYSTLKRAAQGLWDSTAHVVVHEGPDTTVIFPDQDLYIGKVHEGDAVVVGYRKLPTSRQPFARVDTAQGTQIEHLGA